MAQPPLAYLWGEDAYGIERAAREFVARLASEGAGMTTWRASGEEEADEGGEGNGTAARRRTQTLEAIEQHLAMAPLFGGGTLVIVRQPGSLLAESGARDRLLAMVRAVPPGNALCFTDLIGSAARGPAAKGVLRDAVAEAGGSVRELSVPAAGRMEAWLLERAAELGTTLEPPAARLLAQRVGGHVREADVDRRRRTELANAELEKLALYRPGESVSASDVDALVSASIPASAWAFLDALGGRSVAVAAPLADRILRGGTPMPVIIAQLYRRLRELILVREHLDAGSRPAEIVRDMKLQPYRAQKLAEQAQQWTGPDLDAALAGLAALDLRSKGISTDGATLHVSDAMDALALQVWLAEHAAPRRSPAVRPGTASRAPG